MTKLQEPTGLPAWWAGAVRQLPGFEVGEVWRVRMDQGKRLSGR